MAISPIPRSTENVLYHNRTDKVIFYSGSRINMIIFLYSKPHPVCDYTSKYSSVMAGNIILWETQVAISNVGIHV